MISKYFGIMLHSRRANWVSEKLLTLQMIESYLNSGKRIQNAFNALVRYYSLQPPSLQTSQAPFRTALDRYYQRYSSRPVCFNALQPYVHRLHPTIQLDFLEHSAAYAACLQQGLSDSEVTMTLSESI